MKSSLFTWLLYICGLLENVKHSHFSGFFCFYIFFKSYTSHIQGRKVFWHIVLCKCFEPPFVSLHFARKMGNRCSVLLKLEIIMHRSLCWSFFYFLKTWLSATVHLLYIVFSSATSSCPVLSFLRWPFWDIPSFCLISPWITFLVQKIQFNPCQTVIVGFLKKIPIHIFFLIFGMFYLFILSLIPL